jgi:hypothetical protein
MKGRRLSSGVLAESCGKERRNNVRQFWSTKMIF